MRDKIFTRYIEVHNFNSPDVHNSKTHQGKTAAMHNHYHHKDTAAPSSSVSHGLLDSPVVK